MHPSKLPSQAHLNNVFPSYMQNSDEYLQHPGIGTTGRKKKERRHTTNPPQPASAIILKMLPKQIVLAAVARQQSHGGVQSKHM